MMIKTPILPFFAKPDFPKFSRAHSMGIIKQIHSEIHTPKILAAKKETFILTEAKKNHTYNRKTTVHEMLQTKRLILISKINQLNKKEQIKSLTISVEFKEKNMTFREDDFEQNNILLKNMVSKTTEQVCQSLTKVSKAEINNNLIISKLHALKNSSILKQTELKNLDSKLIDLKQYKVFFQLVKTLGVKSEKNIEECFSISETPTFFKSNNASVFLTDQGRESLSYFRNMSLNNELDKFGIRMFKLEDENFNFFEQAHFQENKLEELDIQLNLRTTHAQTEYEDILKTHKALCSLEANLIHQKNSKLTRFENLKIQEKNQGEFPLKKFIKNENEKGTIQKLGMDCFLDFGKRILRDFNIKNEPSNSLIDYFIIIELIYEFYAVQRTVLQKNLPNMLALLRKLFNQNYRKNNTVNETENFKIALEKRDMENNNLKSKMGGKSKARNILHKRFPLENNRLFKTEKEKNKKNVDLYFV